jgi:predicted RNA-binding Zn ribbon-like protein
MVDVVEDELLDRPGAALLRDFVNSREPQVGTDELADPAALRRWFAAHGLAVPRSRFDAGDLARAVDVREGLRALFLDHAGHDADPGAVRRLNEVLAGLPVSLRVEAGVLRVVPGGDDALARPLAGIADAIRVCREDGSWSRLKVCARDTCRWAFYDASRNQARRWCSMAGCGNHVKMKRAYARRTSADR